MSRAFSTSVFAGMDWLLYTLNTSFLRGRCANVWPWCHQRNGSHEVVRGTCSTDVDLLSQCIVAARTAGRSRTWTVQWCMERRSCKGDVRRTRGLNTSFLFPLVPSQSWPTLCGINGLEIVVQQVSQHANTTMIHSFVLTWKGNMLGDSNAGTHRSP